MTTLIITDSWDATSDLVVTQIGSAVFRLNTDLVRDYVLDLQPRQFMLRNPCGRVLHSRDVKSIYWRKPFTSELYSEASIEAFFYAECRYAIRELYNICRAGGASCLVEEGAERRLGKLRQMQIAATYFTVPDWRVALGMQAKRWDSTVVKSLSGEPIDDENVMYTSVVDEETLSLSHLWFVQKTIKKDADITVVYIDGKCFAFKCDSLMGLVDWREGISEMTPADWFQVTLDDGICQSIKAFMSDCRLRYGRLDFVTQGEDLYFLEVNPNGQRAWLDLYSQHGLMDAMIAAILSEPIA